MNKLVVWLLLLAICTPAFADKPLAPAQIPGATILSAEQLIEKIQTTPDLVIIDTRRHEEFAKGHIEGAVFLLDTDMTQKLLAKYVTSKTTPVAFYCNGVRCLRSSNAVLKALSWGYHNVYWFRGGWQEWTNKELPITK